MEIFWDFPPLKLPREIHDLNEGIRMGLVVRNLGWAYARLAWATHSSRTRLKSHASIAQRHSVCLVIIELGNLGDFVLILMKMKVWY